MQLAVKSKPNVTCSNTSSRAWCGLHVFTSSFYWTVGVLCDWPDWLLWFWFYHTKMKTALLLWRHYFISITSVKYNLSRSPQHHSVKDKYYEIQSVRRRSRPTVCTILPGAPKNGLPSSSQILSNFTPKHDSSTPVFQQDHSGCATEASLSLSPSCAGPSGDSWQHDFTVSRIRSSGITLKARSFSINTVESQ